MKRARALQLAVVRALPMPLALWMEVPPGVRRALVRRRWVLRSPRAVYATGSGKLAADRVGSVKIERP